MVKIFYYVACFFLLFDSSTLSTNIECKYEISHSWYYYIGRVYQCIVYQTPRIRSIKDAQITSVSGEHLDSNINTDVLGFTATYMDPIHYFPQGLENIFGKLNVISIYRCGLKEIHQSDLKPFPELTYFSTAFNDIKVVEEGLFDFNPKLSFVEFQERNLIHVDSTVFDHLDQLGYFWMAVVPCVKKEIWDSKEDVLEIIKVVKNQCVSSQYLSLEEEMIKLESESKTLDTTAFKTSLKAFDSKFSNSVFLNFRPLKNKYEALKA